MIELEGVPELVDPVMVAAFEGWNDAGDAASTAVGHMEREWKGEVFAALDAEDYYDFQVNRPQVWLDGGSRKITWPTTRLAVVRVDDAGGKGRPRDLVLVRGIEPSMRWRSFCNEILGFAHELGVEMVVVLGALLGDTPHTRPVPVTGVTSDPDLARTMNLEESRYEGPTGIVGILQEACTHAGVPAVSLWASVPHYVSQPPNPKATLALINRLEDLLGLNVPLGELQEDARAWQLGVDQLAAEDSEVAEYVQSLEEARDTAELPEASGEAIAKEFERYLRRRDDGPGTGLGGSARESGAGSPPAFGGESPRRGPGGGRSRPAKPSAKGGAAGGPKDDGEDDKARRAEQGERDGEDPDAGTGREAGTGEDAHADKDAHPDKDPRTGKDAHTDEDAGGDGGAGSGKPAKPARRTRGASTRSGSTGGAGKGGSSSTSSTSGRSGGTSAEKGTRSTGRTGRSRKPAADSSRNEDEERNAKSDGEGGNAKKGKPESSADGGRGESGDGGASGKDAPSRNDGKDRRSGGENSDKNSGNSKDTGEE
ncbi:Proteasome assembly chaperone (PAC2) family protein [Streptomyces sp. WMMB 322]|nr:Proteasome assembly chaperone (PAC2) family protein [Streptomyces sp. WMMB 322]